MAINKNHLFEDLDGIKCAIVETGANANRVEFLKSLLQHNGYEVVVVPDAPPKGAKPAAKAAMPDTETPALAEPAPLPTAFTVGVTDVMFNATNAIFGRSLRAEDGSVVTMAYWLQKTATSNEEVPYYECEALVK